MLDWSQRQQREQLALFVPGKNPAEPVNRRRKPEWVKKTVLQLFEQTNLSHRKLADLFNQLYCAMTGVSVGKTWVRELLIKQAGEALHAQQQYKHRIPEPLPNNRMWQMDTTCITDIDGKQHIAFGIIDRGSRLCIALRRLRRFNAWTCLGCLFLAFSEYGPPRLIKSDNHAVFRSRMIKTVLSLAKVK